LLDWTSREIFARFYNFPEIRLGGFWCSLQFQTKVILMIYITPRNDWRNDWVAEFLKPQIN
jgi:hypothetical protein